MYSWNNHAKENTETNVSLWMSFSFQYCCDETVRENSAIVKQKKTQFNQTTNYVTSPEESHSFYWEQNGLTIL